MGLAILMLFSLHLFGMYEDLHFFVQVFFYWTTVVRSDADNGMKLLEPLPCIINLKSQEGSK
jgi:hypothetical protein